MRDCIISSCENHTQVSYLPLPNVAELSTKFSQQMVMAIRGEHRVPGRLPEQQQTVILGLNLI